MQQMKTDKEDQHNFRIMMAARSVAAFLFRKHGASDGTVKYIERLFVEIAFMVCDDVQLEERHIHFS